MPRPARYWLRSIPVALVTPCVPEVCQVGVSATFQPHTPCNPEVGVSATFQPHTPCNLISLEYSAHTDSVNLKVHMHAVLGDGMGLRCLRLSTVQCLRECTANALTYTQRMGAWRTDTAFQARRVPLTEAVHILVCTVFPATLHDSSHHTGERAASIPYATDCMHGSIYGGYCMTHCAQLGDIYMGVLYVHLNEAIAER